jgi:hypothetical protein
MCNLIGKIIFIFSAISLLFNLPVAIAYQSSVHKKITEHTVLKSQRIQSALEAVGILQHDGDLKDFGIRNWSYSDWIQCGANWEDGIQLVWGEPMDIAFCHFYNPVTDQGYTLSSGAEIGQSLIARSHDVTNEWSYEIAKKLYYAALIGDNREIVGSFTRMRVGWLAPYFLYQNINMNEEDRNQYFAWMLQALGHTLHLIQDASVPAHTRNDSHGLLEPYDYWTNNKVDDLEKREVFLGAGSDPWGYWGQNQGIKVPNVYFDTDKLQDAETPPITGLNQGIAEYSQANFLSEDTILDDGQSETINTLRHPVLVGDQCRHRNPPG